MKAEVARDINEAKVCGKRGGRWRVPERVAGAVHDEVPEQVGSMCPNRLNGDALGAIRRALDRIVGEAEGAPLFPDVARARARGPQAVKECLRVNGARLREVSIRVTHQNAMTQGRPEAGKRRALDVRRDHESLSRGAVWCRPRFGAVDATPRCRPMPRPAT